MVMEFSSEMIQTQFILSILDAEEHAFILND